MKKVIFIIVLLVVSKMGFTQTQYSIKNLKMNTKYSDFGVAYYGDNDVVYSSSKRNGALRLSLWRPNKQPYLEMYKGSINEDGEINETGEFSTNLNTKFHESNVAFTTDNKTVYFSRNNYYKRKYGKDAKGWNNIKLFKASVNNEGDWENIQSLPFNNDAYSVGHPALNEDGTYLYFTSDMPGSIGLTDIYKVRVNSDGTYGEPENLGEKINSTQKEMFPYVYKNTLYFSSEGHQSIGGLDTYKAEIETKALTAPVNLGTPFNSEKDDFAFVLQQTKEHKEIGYFSSNRTGGKGDDDIYYFEELKCTQLLKGIVKSNNIELAGATVGLYYGNQKEVLEEQIVDSDGKFSFNVDCTKKYRVVANKIKHEEASKLLDTDAIFGKENQLQLNLKEKEFVVVREQTMINLNPIYFDLDSSYIRDVAAIELDRVVELMNKYPTLIIECNSHTDSRASDTYNLWLSKRRALSTADYIISKGIHANRVLYNGYGETALVNNCSNNAKCTDAEHQLNRRSEFVIKNKEVIAN